MRLVKDELGDARVGVGTSGAEQEEDEEAEEEEGDGEKVVEVVLPRMSSM